MILSELQKHGKGMFGISCLEFFAQNSQHIMYVKENNCNTNFTSESDLHS